jgi:transketolase
MTYPALVAAEKLFGQGINAEVIHCPTIKPLDAETIVRSAKRTKRVVTIEEAQIHGGLGGAVCEVLAERCPVPVHRIGMPDHFGESGDPADLLEKFGLTAKHIQKAIRQFVDTHR